MANDNIISFKDAILARQASSTSTDKDKPLTEKSIDSVIVALKDNGEKTLERSKKDTESLSSQLKNISVSMDKLSATLERSLGKNGTVTKQIETQSSTSETQEENQRNQTVLVDKLIEGIGGLKKSLDKGLGKLGENLSEGFGKMHATYKEGGSGWGGLKGIFGSGKDKVGGSWRGIKDAFNAGNASGGMGMGMGRAVAAMSPTAAATLSGGMGYVGNAIANAGPLATTAGIGLAGMNLIDTVQSNAQKSEDIEANVKAGTMTRNEGNVLQGESFGGTAGMAFGASIGGIAGSALGPLGAALGAWAGGKIGNWAGGKIGKYGVKAYQGIKSMFGFGETKEQEQAKMTPEQKDMNQFVNGEIDAEQFNKNQKLRNEGGAAPAPGNPFNQPTESNAQEPIKPAPVTSASVSSPSSPTGIFDNIKSGASWLGGKITAGAGWAGDKIKAGAGWVGNKASELGSAVAGKASEWGTGIKNWFGEKTTNIKNAWEDRGKDVSDASGPRGTAEAKIGSATNMTTTEDASGAKREFNEGITNEKSMFGSSWLGKLTAKKGTETEQFLTTTSKDTEGADGTSKSEMAQFMGSRKDGGWFGKDTYTIGEDEVDKATYMKAKKIASEGGDATQIQGIIDKYKEAKASNDAALYGSNTNAMGDTTGFNPTPADEMTSGSKGGGWFSGLGSKIKGFFGKKEEKQIDYKDLSSDAQEYQKLKLQMASADAMREGNAYSDVDPETKAKQDAMRKKMEEMGSKLSPEERSQVERNVTPEQAPVKTEKDVGSALDKYRSKKPSIEPAAKETGDVINAKSVEAEDAKENAMTPKQAPVVVNAPSVVNNNSNTSQNIRSPFRNEDSTVNRYLNSRYA